MADWPVDSVQGLLDVDWWIPVANPKAIRRGQLIRAFVSHVDQSPYCLVPEGRQDPAEHRTFKGSIRATKIGDRKRRPRLPVAALPSLPGHEVWGVYRSKVRVCLIYAVGGEMPPKPKGSPHSHTMPTITVLPYYGSDRDGQRAGWPEDLVLPIRHAAFPQYMWDKLPPIGGKKVEESILRLDQAQPIGRSYNSIEPLPWCLSDDALEVVDEWFHWLVHDSWPQKPEVMLKAARDLLLST